MAYIRKSLHPQKFPAIRYYCQPGKWRKFNTIKIGAAKTSRSTLSSTCMTNTYQCISMCQVIHGLLDRVMQLLEVPFTQDGSGYFIKATDGKYCMAGNFRGYILYFVKS